METRVLTLFDDDFFPQEPPKEKTKKEKTTKNPATSSEDVTVVSGEGKSVSNEVDVHSNEPFIFQEEDIPVTAFESERLVDDKIPVNESVFFPATTTSVEHHEIASESEKTETELELNANDIVGNSEPIDEIQAEDISVDAESVAEIENQVENITESVEQAIEPTDTIKELNQQILSECIQLDYTALMQKDYAFDLNNATVINKELPKQKIEPVVTTTEEVVEEVAEVFEEITPLPEWNLDKKYYTIGEVAQLFTVNTSHIRFWTNEFKLKPRTTRKGDRLYSPKDIAELRLIHHLVKEKKHTIKGAREKLKVEKNGVNNKLDLKESLVQLRATLLKIKEQL